MKLTKVKGIVIKEVKTGEADKIITIFTKQLGKIQVVAKGARRPQSRLIAGTQFLSFSDFVLFKSQNWYNIRDCNVIESFHKIRYDLDKITYASHIIDLIEEVTEENLSYSNLLQLLLNTLYMLSYTQKSATLITLIFEIKLMSLIGFLPEIIECINCKKPQDQNVSFSAELGGILCSECSHAHKSAIKVSSGTLSAIRYIVYCNIKKAFSFEVSDSVLNELGLISKKYTAVHLNKNFNKLNFLNSLNKSDQKNE